MVPKSAPDTRLAIVDWLVAVWAALCALLFTAPIVVATLLPRHALGLALVEELEMPGRCVYVVVIGLCFLSAALRAARHRSRTGRMSDS